MSNDEDLPAEGSKSPTPSTWQWPTCNCSEEELRRLLPTTSGNTLPRQSIRRGHTDTTTMFSNTKMQPSDYGALRLPPASPMPIDGDLEQQLLANGEGLAYTGHANSASHRQLALWRLGVFVLLIVAFGEGVLLYYGSCARSQSPNDVFQASRWTGEELDGVLTSPTTWSIPTANSIPMVIFKK